MTALSLFLLVRIQSCIGLLVRYQFNPAVLGPSFSRLVGSDEVRLPIPVRAHAAFRHFVVCQVPHAFERHRTAPSKKPPEICATYSSRIIAYSQDYDMKTREVRTANRLR
jgi:hypothetical protein